MSVEKVVIIGNFGIEHVKEGRTKNSFPGGSAFRFALLASSYLPKLEVFSIVGRENLWNEALIALTKNGVDLSHIEGVDHGINFFTFYDEQRNLLGFRIMNSSLMDRISKQDVGKSLNKSTLLHICPLNYESQERLVNEGIQNHSLVSLQMHHSSITDSTREKYINLLKQVHMVFMTEKEAMILTKSPSVDEAGGLLSGNTKSYVFITRGEQGVVVYKYGKKLFEVKPDLIANPENLEGAGDAFASGVIVGYVKTNDITQAVNLGLTTARLSIQAESTKNMIQSINENK